MQFVAGTRPRLDFRPFHFWAYILASDSQWPTTLEAVIANAHF